MQQIQMAVKQADEEAVAQDTTPDEVVRERRNDLDQLTQVYNIILHRIYTYVCSFHIPCPHMFILY